MNFIRNRTTVKVLLCVCLVLGSAATVMAVKPVLFGLTVAPKKIMVGESWDGQYTYSNNSRSIATLNGDVYATWSKWADKLYVSVNREGTGYFESHVAMEGPDTGYGADMVATSDNVGNPELHLAWYTDGGKIYYARTRIGDSRDWVPYRWTSSLVYEGEPLVNWSNSIAADDAGNVHIAFPARDTATGISSLYIINSDNRGVSFNDPVQITPSLIGISGGVSIAKDGTGNLHAVWVDYPNLYYANSTDGVIWSDKVAIPNTSTGGYVSLATTQDGKIYAVVRDSVNGLVCIAYDPATGWSQSTVDSEGKQNPSIAVSPNGDVNVAYAVGKAIYLKRSLSQGNSWEPRVEVQAWDDTGGGTYPSVTVGADNKAHIVWTDYWFIAYTHEQ